MVLRPTSEPIIKVFRSILTAISYAQKMVSHKIRKFNLIRILRGMKTIYALYKHGRTINKYFFLFGFPFSAPIVNCKLSFSLARIYQKSEVNTAKPVCFSTSPQASISLYPLLHSKRYTALYENRKDCKTEVPSRY